jgi:hypothetical protein
MNSLNFLKLFSLRMDSFCLSIPKDPYCIYKTPPFCPIKNTFKALYPTEPHFPKICLIYPNVSLEDFVYNSSCVSNSSHTYRMFQRFFLYHNSKLCRMKRSDCENRIMYFLQPLSWIQICPQYLILLKARGPSVLIGPPRPCIQMLG